MTGGNLGFYVGAAIVFGVIGLLIAIARGQPAWLGFVLGFCFSCLGVGALLLMRSGLATAAGHGIPPPHPGSQWLADPTGRHQYRLWDGHQWSAHVSDSGRSGYDPL